MAQAVRAAGNERVALVQVSDRDHASLWNRLGAPGDEVARHIITFVRANEVAG